MLIREHLLSSAALGALAACFGVVSIDPAGAGGFAIREQSTSSQGASFAGSAANSDLSAMFWNPAAAANKAGVNSEANFSLIVPNAEISLTSAAHPNPTGLPSLNNSLNAAGSNSGNIGSLALLASSYFSYQFKDWDPNFFLGIALNSPFGLKTDLDKSHETYKGAVVGRESRLLTFNLNPTFAYRISSSLAVGVGAQIQYGDARFSFASGTPAGADSRFDGNGVALGATAGIMWKPTSSTTVGLGWRSQLSQELQGSYINTPAVGPAAGLPGGVRSVGAQTTLELPNIVTFSVRQEVTSNTRLMGTVEWSQWSRLKELRLTADGSSSGAASGVLVPAANGASTLGVVPGQTIGTLPADWSDGWFFGLGGEYDLNRQLTVRAGGAYEISPIDAPRKRLIGIPDNDRIWASLGATYKWSEFTSFDVAYTHLFVKDGQVDRESLAGVRVLGNVDASTDIISVAMKSKW